jgi:anti-anti-sigma factor
MHVEHEYRSPGSEDVVPAQLGERRSSRGELTVRRERRGDAVVLWLAGTLDQATSALLERELDALATHSQRLLLDVTGLESVDTYGLDTLSWARRQARASEAQFSIERTPGVGHDAICIVPRATAPPLGPAA